MKQELVKLDEEMNNEIKMIKDKYSCLKENVHKGQNRNKFKKEQSILFLLGHEAGSCVAITSIFSDRKLTIP